MSDGPSVLTDVVKRALARTEQPDDAVAALLAESLGLEKSRDGAWPLLAADALLTQLCRDAVSDPASPEDRFAELYRLCLTRP